MCYTCVGVSELLPCFPHLYRCYTHVLEAVEAVTGSVQSPICLLTLLTDLVPHSQKREVLLTPHARMHAHRKKKKSHTMYTNIESP